MLMKEEIKCIRGGVVGMLHLWSYWLSDITILYMEQSVRIGAFPKRHGGINVMLLLNNASKRFFQTVVLSEW